MTSMQHAFVSAVGSSRGPVAADRLCEACVDLLMVDAAAISLVFDGANTGTLGASGEQARVYDELQFTLGEGPCLESVSVRNPVLVGDLAYADEARWPAYGTAMLAHGVHGVFALPVLVAGEYLGALDLFRRRPGLLDDDDLAGALVAAELAELPLLDLLAVNLQAAVVRSRQRRVGRAGRYDTRRGGAGHRDVGGATRDLTRGGAGSVAGTRLCSGPERDRSGASHPRSTVAVGRGLMTPGLSRLCEHDDSEGVDDDEPRT